MRILTIIGGNGFLGKSVIDYALKGGLSRWKISKIISISRSKVFINLEKAKIGKHIKIEYLKGDVSKSSKLPYTDYIIYAANSKNNKENLKAIKNFSLLIKKLPKKTKILFTSSGAVYGNIDNFKKTISEKTKITYKNMIKLSGYKKEYAKTKLLIEEIFKKYGKHGYNVSIARCFTFFGNRILDKKNYAISDFINHGFYKKKILVKSNYNVYRSYMYSDDIVKWLMTILFNSSSQCPVYNVGSDKPISLQSLAKLIGKIFKKPVQITKIYSKKIDRYVPSTKKAQKELNLKINYKLKPSLYSIVKWRNEQKK